MKKYKGSFFKKQLILKDFKHKRTKVAFWLDAKDHENVTLTLAVANTQHKHTFKMDYIYSNLNGCKIWYFQN